MILNGSRHCHLLFASVTMSWGFVKELRLVVTSNNSTISYNSAVFTILLLLTKHNS